MENSNNIGNRERIEFIDKTSINKIVKIKLLLSITISLLAGYTLFQSRESGESVTSSFLLIIEHLLSPMSITFIVIALFSLLIIQQKILGAVLYAFFFFCALSVIYPLPHGLTLNQVSDDLDFLIPQEFPHIDSNYLGPVFSYTPQIEILGPVGEYSVAIINVPYREFPNVLVYRFNSENKIWKRILEGVSLGVSLPAEGSVDLHVPGMALDFAKTANAGKDNQLINYWLQNKYIVTEYDKFIHVHMGGRELYTINRTEFPSIAQALVGAPYTDFRLLDNKEDLSCKSYDTPKLNRATFTKIGIRYVLVGITDNNQKWTLTFTGADELHLLNRGLAAERMVVLVGAVQ